MKAEPRSAPGGSGAEGAAAPQPRVLVLRALGLGDLLTVVPCLRALRRSLSGHEIVLAAPQRLAAAAAATGLVDRTLAAEASGRQVPADIAWHGPPPDIAVDLHGNGPPSHLLLQRLGPGRMLAYRHPQTPGIRGPFWRADEHERDRWCRLLRWYGIPAEPGDLSIPPPQEPSPAPGAVVIHPGADAGARRWPPERFSAVAAALRRAGHRVVVTAGAAEGRLAHSVAAEAGLPPGAVLGGAADVPFSQISALIAGARCVVVGDTGVAHLASALGTPSVILFGPVSPRLWGPPALERHRVLWHPEPGDDPLRPGDAHGSLPDRRLLRITVEEVIDAVDDLLGPSPSPSPSPSEAGDRPNGLRGGAQARTHRRRAALGQEQNLG
ncbi:glycosyltransferase family 9 protein [Streptomyces sp. NPDC003038]|uniref:glycosyltransferase family 9 protein n=1 Tax=unclassified Streptomyces TaxID=2593676 RepID=UPI0033B441A9